MIQKKKKKPRKSNQDIGVTEFVGTTDGDTIGLVIAGVDSELAKKNEPW